MEKQFIKPERKIINPISYLTKIMGNGLIKDLGDKDIICPECEGTGLAIHNNRYGLSDDPDKKAGMFPYKHQSIGACLNCYNGVLKVCNYCGTAINRKLGAHRCEGIRAEERASLYKKERELFDKSIKLNYNDDEAKSMQMMYSEHYGYNEGYFSNWDEFFEYWFDTCYELLGTEEDEEINELKPKYVWGTYEASLSFDIDNILEMATEELHEEALNSITEKDYKELKDLLQTWANKQSGTITYYQDYKYSILIPWELYKN